MENRLKKHNKHKDRGNVLYIMKRDQRIFDNHALNFAVEVGKRNKSKIYIGVKPLKYNDRQKMLIIQGIEEMKREGTQFNLPISILEEAKDFIQRYKINTVILDYCPIREYLKYDDEVIEYCNKKKMAIYTCDAHNMVPWALLEKYKRTSSSVKMDLYKLFPKYCNDFQSLEVYPFNDTKEVESINKTASSLGGTFNIDEKNVSPSGGYKNGMATFWKFINEKNRGYKADRNDPSKDGLSNLSQYLHLGHVSPQKIIYLYNEGVEDSEVFLNEIFVWRETAEHFCSKEKNYDNIEGALGWVKESLAAHKSDVREYLYSLEQFENSETHESLWNAAQTEMVVTGKMHGYVRMYWAKQIMKWTENVDRALEIAIYLNDKYSSDGNDPNGYLGVMWSICGSMDRAFKDRPITGKIRPMNTFKANDYISKWKRP